MCAVLCCAACHRCCQCLCRCVLCRYHTSIQDDCRTERHIVDLDKLLPEIPDGLVWDSNFNGNDMGTTGGFTLVPVMHLPPDTSDARFLVGETVLEESNTGSEKKQHESESQEEEAEEDISASTGASKACMSRLTMATSSSIAKVEEQLASGKLLEVCLTLVYREGSCQLNQYVQRHQLRADVPKALMLALNREDGEPEYVYISTDSNHWQHADQLRNFLHCLLASLCRKICFRAQELAFVLMSLLGSERTTVLQGTLFLDPLVGCWLLDPDHPTYDFAVVRAKLGLVQFPEEEHAPTVTETHAMTCHLLGQLSLVMQTLYFKLQQAGLWKLFVHLEMPLVPVLAAMEYHGVCVDMDKLGDMAVLLQECLVQTQEEAYEAAGKRFQLRSTVQLRKVLYEELRLDTHSHVLVEGTTAAGEKSTSEAMLHLMEAVHPLPGIVLRYRHLYKIKSTYVDAIMQHADGGHVYSTWELVSSATGRITSSHPNLQSLPKQPVDSIIPDPLGVLLPRAPYRPHPGFCFVAADFQHIELRICAHLSQDTTLLAMFHEAEDVFVSLAKRWLGVLQDREKTKHVVYAVLYGAGPGKLSQLLRVSRTEARAIIDSFTERFPALKMFSHTVVRQCREDGLLQTLSGRRRLFPDINSDDVRVRGRAQRQAVNFVIQGSAADVCKAFTVHLDRWLAAHPQMRAHLVLQVHDELVWEVEESCVNDLCNIIEQAVEDCSTIHKHVGNLSVPLALSVSTGRDLAHMKTTKNVCTQV